MKMDGFTHPALMLTALLATFIHGLNAQSCPSDGSAPTVTSRSYTFVNAATPAGSSPLDANSIFKCGRLCKDQDCKSFRFDSSGLSCYLAFSELEILPGPVAGSEDNLWLGPLAMVVPVVAAEELEVAYGPEASETDVSDQPQMAIPVELPCYNNTYTTSDTIKAETNGCLFIDDTTAGGKDTYICPLSGIGTAFYTGYRDSEGDATLLAQGTAAACACLAATSQNPPCCFEATYVFEATWENITSDEYPSLNATMQVMIVTDGVDSFILLHYLHYTGPTMSDPFAIYVHDVDLDPASVVLTQNDPHFFSGTDPEDALTNSNIALGGFMAYSLKL